MQYVADEEGWLMERTFFNWKLPNFSAVMYGMEAFVGPVYLTCHLVPSLHNLEQGRMKTRHFAAWSRAWRMIKEHKNFVWKDLTTTNSAVTFLHLLSSCAAWVSLVFPLTTLL